MMTSKWVKLQDQPNYISNEKTVFLCKVLSITKEQRENKTRKWEDTNKNNEQLYSATKIPPAVSVNVSASAFCSK